jgi:hypothetical protein
LASEAAASSTTLGHMDVHAHRRRRRQIRSSPVPSVLHGSRGRRSQSSPGPTVLLAGYDGGRGDGARAAEGRGPGGAEADDAKQLRDDDDGIPSLLRAAAVEEEDLVSLAGGSSSHGERGQGLDERR